MAQQGGGMGSFMGGGYGGAIAGAIGGLAGTRSKPPRYTPEASLYESYYSYMNPNDPAKYNKKGKQKNYFNNEDLAYANQDFGSMRDFNLAGLAGQSYLSDEDRQRLLAPMVGRNAASADAARKRAQERSIGLGVDPRSGMLEEAMLGIDLAELGANRENTAGLANQDALMRAQRSENAANRLQSMLFGDLQHRTREGDKRYQSKVARRQAGNWWQNMLGGAAAGFLGSQYDNGSGQNTAALMDAFQRPTPQGTGDDWMNDSLTWDLEPTQTDWMGNVASGQSYGLQPQYSDRGFYGDIPDYDRVGLNGQWDYDLSPIAMNY